MPLPAFDASKYHIGLGVSGSQKGFLLDGQVNETYQKLGAPAEFGSADDLLAPIPALSRWTQDDFSGGAFQKSWGRDPARFGRSVGFVPRALERSARTVPPLAFEYDAGDTGNIPAQNILDVHAWSDELWVIGNFVSPFEGFIREHSEDFSSVFLSTTDGDRTIYASALDAESGALFLASRHPTTDGANYVIRRSALLPSGGWTGTFSTVVTVSTSRGVPRGMTLRGRDLVIQFGPNLWLGVMNDAGTSAAMTKIGRLPGVWKDSVSFNSALYILLSDGLSRTSVVMFDGTNIFPVVEWPYIFTGEAITAYAGRLYVGGSGYDYDRSVPVGELYEINGSSLRLVDQFTETTHGCDAITDLAVHEGLLLCSSSNLQEGAGMVVYDAITDSLWGAFEQTADDAEQLHIATTKSGQVFVFGEIQADAGDYQAWKIANATAEIPGATHNCILETSDFFPEFDRSKRWSRLRVRTRGGAGLTLEVSTDGGSNFSAVSVASSTTTGDFTDFDFDLTAVSASKQIRFRFTVARTSVSGMTEIVAYTCQFAFFGSDKKAWTVSFLGVEKPVLLDLTSPTAVYDFAEARTQLQTWYEAGTVLAFTDLHGDTYNVIVSDIAAGHPRIADPDGSGNREGYYPAVLLEV